MNFALFAAAAALTAALAAPAVAPGRQHCRDTITLAREAAGQPRLDQGNATAGEPLLIAAVDKRIDNCRVLVMARDSRDIRPEPDLPLGEPRLRPAR